MSYFIPDPRMLEGFRALGNALRNWWTGTTRNERQMDELLSHASRYDPNKPDWDLPPRRELLPEDELLLQRLGVVVQGPPVTQELESLFGMMGRSVVSIVRAEEGLITVYLEGGVSIIWVASVGSEDV